MSITNYSELQTAVANWIDRADLTSRIPEFIALAEAKLNRELRTREQMTSGTDTMSSSAISLPTGWMAFHTIWYSASGVRYELLNGTPQEAMRFDVGGTSPPTGYYISGSTVTFFPDADSDYSVGYIYYKSLTALSDSNTTNWLLTAHPDLYLYGSLLEAAPYIDNPGDIQLWLTAFQGVIEQLKTSDKDVMSGAPMAARAY